MRGNNLELHVTEFLSQMFSQDVNTGALPILFAATAPGLPNNSYVGPEDKWQTRGYPTLVERDESATNALEARRLWIGPKK